MEVRIISGINAPYSNMRSVALSLAEEQYASSFYEKLVEMIREFDVKLAESEEVGMRLVSFGQTVEFHVQDIGYYDPSLIRFFGVTDDGDKIELIQHVSQISFLLMAVNRLNPKEPKKKIGFSSED